MVDKFLTSCASLFELRDPRARVSRRPALLALAVVAILALGALVRFWGLGAVGLHGDEKTMALPTMHLVEYGTPQMPSGMFYARAVGQLYLMAASVEAFGQSEWALRLPSVLCGLLLILLTWTAGRRFLQPAWNLALTAAVALLPDFIDDAQTARMYVFLVASVAGFMTLVFEWERTQKSGYLLAAVAVMLIGLQFHTLAIFAAFIVLMPALLHGDRRRLWAGLIAFALAVAGFYLIDRWVAASYPQDVAADSGPDGNGPRAALIPHIGWLSLAAAAVPALLFAWFVLQRSRDAAVEAAMPQGRAAQPSGLTPMMTVAVVSLGAALVCELSLHYHLAAILIVAALVIARREGEVSLARLATLLVASAVLASLQAAYLYMHAAGTPRQIIGLMLGWPSVWPFIALAQSSPFAAALAAASLVMGVWQLAHRRRVPDFVLLVVLGVWLPLILIGFMRWDIAQRYAEAQSLPLLVGAFAMAQWAAPRVIAWLGTPAAGPIASGVAAVIVCLLVVNPVRVTHTIDSGYTNHPDHKGAAQFIESIHPGPRDIIVAEDVLQQTYYLGHVDYWLVNKEVGDVYLHRVGNRWLDFYTNTPMLGTGADLKALLRQPGRGAVYVIGSGENQEDGRKLMRAFGIAEELQSPSFKVVYRGRDGVTEVWKANAPPVQDTLAVRAGGAHSGHVASETATPGFVAAGRR
jgi:4-amino-4-deoxy-L-arabinose transferase-like glycosyltransferase